MPSLLQNLRQTAMFYSRMIRLVFLAFLVAHTMLLSIRAVANDDVNASIIKITVTKRSPDYFAPWNKASPTQSGGTGFVISGKRIVTNAHVVQHASQVYVQPDQSDEKLEAKVEAMSYGLDLAILRVTDPDALNNIEPLIIDNEITRLRSEVNVYGYPVGGNQIAITKGVVSRIEYTRIGGYQLGLRAQIDAAINPGNSGGPAISNGKVVGVAFSGLQNANSIGYLIHSTELDGFLRDVKDGRSTGNASIWEYFQPTENLTLRSRLRLPKGSGGLMVSGIRDPKGNPLKVDDVITKIGPHAIDSQGNVKVGDLTLNFSYYCPVLEKDGKVPLTIWREGHEIELNCWAPKEIRSVLPEIQGNYPRYFIFGPITFEAATYELAYSALASTELAPYLGAYSSPLISNLTTPTSESLQELVLIPAALFSHRSTKGYRSPVYCVVKSINQVNIRSLNHLVELIRDCQDEYLEIEFADRGSEKLIFNRKEMASETESILAENNIRKQFSDDLIEVWNGGKPK